jgi:hypothetical protein
VFRKSLIAVAHLGRNFRSGAAGMMFKSDIFCERDAAPLCAQAAYLSKLDISGIGVSSAPCQF